jgi:hypothetical protein
MKNKKYTNEQIIKFNRLKSYLIHKYGHEIGNKKYISLMRGMSLKVCIFKFGKEEGLKFYKNRIEKDKIKNTLIGFIKRYGEIEGTKKYYEKNKKLSVSIESLKLNGYGDNEINKIKQKHSKKSSLKNKYGEKKYKEYLENGNHFNPRKIESYLKKGIDINIAKDKISKIQNRDLKFYINKYGEINGIKKYNQVNEKRRFSNTVEYYIIKYGKKDGIKRFNEKYGEEEGLKIYFNNKKNGFSQISKIEIEFKQFISVYLKEFSLVGSPLTESKLIIFKDNLYGLKYCIPDLIINDKVIVEFNGDYWHSFDWKVENDKKRTYLLEEMGYVVINVKEKEYKKNKNLIIENTVNKIKNILKNEN